MSQGGKEEVTDFFENSSTVIIFLDLGLTNKEFIEGIYPFSIKHLQESGLILDRNDINLSLEKITHWKILENKSFIHTRK